MPVSERKRRELYEALETRLGPEPADTLIEMLSPLASDDPVARKSDIVALRGEMAELRGEIKAILPKLVAANVASMVGVSGLVIASAHFL